MQHPFITDLSDKSMEDLSLSIGELTKKLNFAYRMQHSAMISQLQMILESYKIEYNKRMDEIYTKQNLGNKINIADK